MIAFLREVSPRLDRCELTYQSRAPIDDGRARQQHEVYATTLRELGARIEFFAAAPELPDGVFVEDTAVLLPEVAVMGRPGVASRQREIESVAPVLAQYLPVRSLCDGQLEGGDVLRIGRHLYVGRARRTNDAGVSALRKIVGVFGYEVSVVNTRDCLHLKTACTFVPPHFLLANPAWVSPDAFGHLTVIAIDAAEPGAANTLTLAGTTLISASFPKTERRLRAAGLATRAVDISELEKAEAGLTCVSLILAQRGESAG